METMNPSVEGLKSSMKSALFRDGWMRRDEKKREQAECKKEAIVRTKQTGFIDTHLYIASRRRNRFLCCRLKGFWDGPTPPFPLVEN